MTLNALNVVMAIFLQIWKYILVFLYPLSNRCIARESKSIFSFSFDRNVMWSTKFYGLSFSKTFLRSAFGLVARQVFGFTFLFKKKMKSKLKWQQFGIILTVKRPLFFLSSMVTRLFTLYFLSGLFHKKIKIENKFKPQSCIHRLDWNIPAQKWFTLLQPITSFLMSQWLQK